MDIRTLLLQITVALFAVLLLHRLWTKKVTATTGKGPPEPSDRRLFSGHLHLLAANEPLCRTLATLAETYGPVFLLRLGWRRTLVVSSYELAKECFTVGDRALAGRPNTLTGEIIGYNHTMVGLATHGPLWREIRKIATLEFLSNRRLEGHRHVWSSQVDTCVKDLYGLWLENRKQPVVVEMKGKLTDLSFNVLVRMVAGTSWSGAGEVEERLRRGIREWYYLSGVFLVSDAFPFLRWLDLWQHGRDMKRVAGDLDSIAGSWVTEHSRKKDSGDSMIDECLVSLMLQSLPDDPSSKPHTKAAVVKANALAMMVAGTETIAGTLARALSLLLNNPHVLKKAQDELDHHVGHDRHVDESDLRNLKYLEAIEKEAMRLYPAAPLLLPHEAIEECHVGGFRIQAGTRLLVNIWKIQRDPQIWKDPLEFKPERFLTSHVGIDVRGHHFELLPFGAGRRICPGTSLSLYVIRLTLARLLHGFEWSTLGDVAVDMSEGIGLSLPKACPLEVMLSPRLPSTLYQ